jgi:N-acetyl sugar amidotransferase
MQYCTRCVYPAAAAAPLTFDANGVCSGCRVYEQRKAIDWDQRWQFLVELVEQYRGKGRQYDCMIPVSGGKDSWFQTHTMISLGLKPLLVTYYGNNYSAVGERNLKRIAEVFDCDHIVFKPSVKTLVKLNRLCFKKMGDMNWHNHAGIFTYPVRIAAELEVPLLIWGEHGYTDLAGMYSMHDFIEMTAKFRLEHAQRGYDWFDMITDDSRESVGVPRRNERDPLVEEEGLRAQDMLWARYPSDEELDAANVRGIYLGNYVNWESNSQTQLVIEKYGWEPSPEPFDRTYRRQSNLDDIHENGVHDYLKYVKFGYGRATDHACKDIRAGLMSRDEAIEMVRRYDHVKPRDLKRWLEYTGITEAEFDRIADTFRSPRVWRKNAQGAWEKENLWDDQHRVRA